VVLALPSGVVADRLDRRRVLLAAQIAMLAVTGVLTALAFAHALTPALLLVLTFLLGCGTALMGPAWQAIQPEPVERRQLGQAVVRRSRPACCLLGPDAPRRPVPAPHRALSWGLYQDGNDPERFIENYVVASWADHLAQHHTRLTGTDRGFEEQARDLLLPGTRPEVTHAFDVATGRPRI
jgi:hypothetical protein